MELGVKIQDPIDGSIKREAAVLEKLVFAKNQEGKIECLAIIKECIAISDSIDSDISPKGYNNLNFLVTDQKFVDSLNALISTIMTNYTNVIGKQVNESSLND